VPAMQSGIYWGYVGLIEGLVLRIGEELGAAPTVIATGGLAPLFADATAAIDHVAPDLTLDGLVLLAERNLRETA
ncbi:MAG: pantothenate kinase, partial [Acetobacteraceae bacterium]